MIQTHISPVFLSAEHVFKFKRPVNFGFADFRRLSRRLHYCHEEVRLNRRLAPDVYLDVVPLTLAGDTFEVGGSGAAIDHMVVMRRLPQSAMMDTMLVENRVMDSHMDALAQFLADFHRQPSRRQDLARYGAVEILRENWAENFDQVAPLIGQTITRESFDAIRQAVENFFVERSSELEQRVSGGHIRDGHGDLRCEHIMLHPETHIIDCIEFNDRFRFGDTANDLAFLLMDLTALGHPDLARHLLAQYVSVADDPRAVPLTAFYACYRAFVRGKVLGFKLGDRSLSKADRNHIAARARNFFALASRFAAQMPPPVLVLVSGLMGSGKSALAAGLAGRWGVRNFNSDHVRKSLAAEVLNSKPEPGETRGAAFGSGIYTNAWTRRTYASLLDRAEDELAQGRSVILDASFARREDRIKAFAAAENFGADCFLVECQLAESHLLERLERRERKGISISDGRAALLPRQQSAFEPITEIAAGHHIVVDTSGAKGETLQRVLKHPGLSIPPALFAD
jgi:aminoglycoside phosphotransferase family enzyme/predicted kinase